MSTQPKRILVLGGTVYLSRKIATLALERGHQVTVAARGTSGAPPEGAEFVAVDRAADGGLDALRGREFDAVFDVARLPGLVGPALDALADSTGHWSFVSTVSVYADHDKVTGELAEPTGADSLDPAMEHYGASKVACERLVRERVGDKALISRPGLIVGPGDPNDRIGYWILRIAEGGEVLAPGTPERRVQWLDVADFATWLLDAAESGVTGTVDAIGEPVPMGDFLGGIAEALVGLGVAEAPRLTWVPQELLLEHGVNPWAGPDSLGLWVPEPGWDGMMDRPAAPALAAGLRPSTPRATAERWWRGSTEPPRLQAGLTRVKEGAVLAAFHGREPDPDLARLDEARTFAVPETAEYSG